MTPSAATEISGLRKAAVLLLLLGEDIASAIYKHLPEEELQGLTAEIAGLDSVSPTTAGAVLQEYQRMMMTQDYLAQGGPEIARKLLAKAFGDETANDLLDQVMKAQEAVARSFDSLQKADPQQLVKFVQGEHPQTIAMILAHLGGRAATAMLTLLPEKTRAQAVKRLAEMQQFSPELVGKISNVLHRKVQALGDQSRRSYGGVQSAAELLNRMNPNFSKGILEMVEAEDAKLALSIRNLMFTFEDFLTVPETSVRELLGQVDKKGLAMSLKGASDDLKNHFFKTMSSRAVEMLKEDMEALGPVRAQAVTSAQQEIVAAARKMEAEGKLTLNSNQEDSYVV